MIRVITLLLLGLMTCCTGTAGAQCPPGNLVPNVFMPNTPARASEVNANFDCVTEQIVTNAAGITVNSTDITNLLTAVTTLQSEVAALQAQRSAQAAQIAALTAQNNVQAVQISALEDVTQFFSVDSNIINNMDGPHLIVTGANFHIRDGTGMTYSQTPSGVGNLVVGYNESGTVPVQRGGAHNLIIGEFHSFSGTGGIVAGFLNSIAGRSSTVSGGDHNTASADFAAISGGSDGIASGGASAISGGTRGTASGNWSSISGGDENTASGTYSSVTGGSDNIAAGTSSCVTGGENNVAGPGFLTVVSGGLNVTAPGNRDWAAGACFFCDQ